MSFSYVLIGEESLTVRCAELLAARGHVARAAVAQDALVSDWAEKNGIPLLLPSDAAAITSLPPFDYLLSIVNLRMLPQAVLDAPTVAAINFHDGPLPRHAGVNAPVWALIEGDRTFGISWHLMTDGPDEGDILESEQFSIDPGETALSLNLKCFDAAYGAFERLIDRLERRDLAGRPQDFSLRTYHRAADRPHLGGIIDFARPAGEIERLVRALDFGSYRNPVGFARMATRQGAVIVTSAEASGAEPCRPGMVAAVSPEGITMSVGDGKLRLAGFRALAGRPLSSEEAAAVLGIATGDRLAPLTAEDAALLDAAARESAPREVRAVDALRAAGGLELPMVRPATQAATRATFGVPGANLRPEALIAAFGNLLARLGNQNAAPWVLHAPPSGEVVRSNYLCGRPLLFRYGELRRADDPAVRDATLPRLLSRDIEARAQTAPGDRVALVLAGPGDVDASDFDAALFVSASGEWIWEFDASRFEKEDLATFAETLQSVAANAGDPGSLPTGQREILANLNATATEYPRHLTISQVFESAVAAHPDRLAVVGGDVRLTYRELNGRANRLATALRDLGVTPDSLVAVHIDRSADTVTTLLGVQKAGAAYVPVDPA